MTFDHSVFVNCPFDRRYDPLLQAMLFTIVYLKFTPRIARERADGGSNRLDKIVGLIRESKFSIHDLSRARAARRGEFSRHNMPFELGIDYGSRQFGDRDLQSKRFLILADRPYDYMKALSDLNGCDIETHEGKFEQVIRRVRNWLVNEAGAARTDSGGRLVGKYADFSGWHYERQLAAGCDAEEIAEYPTPELLTAMQTWIDAGEPLTIVRPRSSP